MRRDIRFRGKRIDNGEWVYGNLVTYFNKPAIQDYAQTNGEIFLVDPETVGQYSGINDRKAKEIYERHEVKFRKYKIEYTGVVRFEKGCFIVKWESVVGAYGEKATHSEYLKFCEHIEIIGDLLEG